MRAQTLSNAINTRMATALQRIQEALVELDGLDCKVHAVVIKDGPPVMLIETPPGPLIGAVQMHTKSQGVREAHWMAEVAGCRVEWNARPMQAVK